VGRVALQLQREGVRLVTQPINEHLALLAVSAWQGLGEPSDHSELSPRKPPLGSKFNVSTVAPLEPLHAANY
jgi:hypothetical protein